MKRTFLFILAICALSACADDNQVVNEQKGSIRLSSSLEMTEDLVSRATSTDLNDFYVILDGPAGIISMPYPQNNIIDGIAPGPYTLTVSSHPDGFSAPEFDEQHYSGSQAVTVTASITTPVSIVCKQANAGVFFVYDASLADAGMDAIVPTIAQQAGSLIYENANREATGYFLPGEALVTFSVNGESITVGGQLSRTLNLEPAQLWKVTLKVATDSEGGIEIDATIEVINDPTHQEEWELDEPAGESFIDSLIGEWDASNDVLFSKMGMGLGWWPNPHSITISKIDQSTIKIANIFNISTTMAGVYNDGASDEIIAYVDEQERSITIPMPQKMEVTWVPEEIMGVTDTYLTPMVDDENMDVNMEAAFDTIHVQQLAGDRLQIEIRTDLVVPDSDPIDEYTIWMPASFAAVIVVSDMPLTYINATYCTKWTKTL